MKWWLPAAAMLLGGCSGPGPSTLTLHNKTKRLLTVEAVVRNGAAKQVESASLTPGDSLNVTLMLESPTSVDAKVNGRLVKTYRGAELPEVLRKPQSGGLDVNLYVMPRSLIFRGPTISQRGARQNWPMLLTPCCCGLPLLAIALYYTRRKPKR